MSFIFIKLSDWKKLENSREKFLCIRNLRFSLYTYINDILYYINDMLIYFLYIF